MYRDDSDAKAPGARRLVGVPPTDLSRRISTSAALGLSLLYASGYFLPLLTRMGIYLLPTRDLVRAVVGPSLVVVLVGTLGLLTASELLRRARTPRVATVGAILLFVGLTLIALKGVMDVAGIDWQDRIPRSRELLAAQREFKVFAGLVALGVLWALRGRLPKVNRWLSSLGYAFAAFAVFRMLVVWSDEPPRVGVPAVQALSARAIAATAGVTRSRRVVWVIFDEADFNRIYPTAGRRDETLGNFDKLAAAAVFATHANAPASATLFSLPALLTGAPLASPGISVGASGTLSLARADGVSVPFEESRTIFGALAGRGLTASVLGFFHPYCKLFALERCTSLPWPGTQGVAAAVTANLPGIVARKLGLVDSWSTITATLLGLLPEYLARDDALTFVHLNVPHLPATQADVILQRPASSDPLVEYARNLDLADHILGDIIAVLERESARHDVMLVVSSDHWLRNRWYQADQPEVERPVPFIAWKVGDTQGTALAQPVSTVHTEKMVLDFLDGKITTESDIAAWWRGQAYDATFIAPRT